MKRATFLLLPAIAFLNSACERHDASELAKIEESETHHEGQEGHGANAAHEQPGQEKSHESSPAPKFFSR